MIIFGRKVRDKDYGEAYPIHCPNCDNDVYYHAFKWRSWFHIFWIPLIPWTANREVVCPICNAGFEVSKSAFKEAKELVDPTESYRRGNLSDKEYAYDVREFEKEAPFINQPLNPENFEGSAEVDLPEDELDDTELEEPED
ncbi:zinc-ribbon domain-containing protein [Halolamina salifodinae]|uniref:Zinc-ribbon 15 domain-containing protein n=1 Tax=Halolamina salifodinae TaxID=1202767 RepID=A0A8T4GVT0_9EURY|nr:zinc ribbon domain-containing protein [Halolamina salifodinae]MBP1987221.1 hypothetical protein [Halolamina salifodinae]